MAVVRELKRRDDESHLLNEIGNIYHDSLKDYGKAIEYFQQSLAIAQEIKNRPYQITALRGLGLANYHLQGYQKAISYFQQALAIAQEIKDRESEIKLLRNLGNTFSDLKDEPKAITYYEQALKVARESKDRDLERSTLIGVGGDYGLSLGNWQQGIEYNQQALNLARETKNREDEGEALLLIGSAYNIIGNFPKAIDAFQQALIIAQETQELELEAGALANLAAAYFAQGDSHKASDFSQQALAIARGERASKNGQTIKNRELEGFALVILSLGYTGGQSDYQKALELAQQGLGIARESKNRFLESQALDSLSMTYYELSEYPKAIESAQQSLAVAQEIKNPLAEWSSLTPLGMIYLDLGDYQKASSYYQQALAISRKNQSRLQEGIVLLMLGDIYYNQGNTQKTLELAQQAVALFEETKSPALKSIVLSYFSSVSEDLKDYPKAIAQAKEALTIARNLKNRGLEAASLAQLGSLYRKSGQYQQAISFYQQALTSNPNPDLPGSGSGAKTGLARVYHSLNQPTTAIAYYKEAVSGIEQVRQKIQGLPPQLQASFLQVGRDKDKRADIYRELADLLLSQGRQAEAQQVLELLKVQELRDFARNPTNKTSALTTPNLTKTPEIPLNAIEEQIKKENGTLIAFGRKIDECEKTGCSQLSKLKDQRDALTIQFNDKIQIIDEKIRQRPVQDKGYLDPGKLGLKAKQIIEAQPNTVLVYPLVLEDKIWLLWASQGDILKTVEVPVKQSQLVETVRKFRELLQNPNSDIGKVQATGKQLYDWLIKPIEPELEKNQVQNLVFSLDRVTRYIPMSALFDGKKYLIENYGVSTILSADLTDTKDRLPSGKQSISVLGLGVSEARGEFSALPNVISELDAIIQQKPKDTQGIYPGDKFLNNAFDFRTFRDNLRGHKIVHIATHGVFESEGFDNSFLLLGNGEKLTISQIKTLQDLADVHLLVLSACETALGKKGQDGVEINAISYHFLNDGVKAVMASLWVVDDKSTSELMRQFYSNLANTNQTSKVQALRQAQLRLLHSDNTTYFSHPYYWAPFILIGNGL